MRQKAPDEYWMIGSLDHAPAIAEALGNVMVSWSYAESAFLGLLNALVPVNFLQAATIFYSIPTLEGRLKLIGNLVNSRPDHETKRLTAILDAISAVRRLSKARNDFVHNAWAIRADAKATVTFDYLETGAQQRRRTMHPGDMLRHARTVKSRTDNLIVAIKRVFPQAPIDLPSQVPKIPLQRNPSKRPHHKQSSGE